MKMNARSGGQLLRFPLLIAERTYVRHRTTSEKCHEGLMHCSKDVAVIRNIDRGDRCEAARPAHSGRPILAIVRSTIAMCSGF